jgi:hypothetical protein
MSPTLVTKTIAENPPNDGREWDCQCARCGSSCYSASCEHCGGSGVDDWDEGDWDYEGPSTCDICQGEGGWMVCCSSLEWCEAHPIEGREAVTRGQIEWFTFDGRQPDDEAPSATSQVGD